MSEEVSSMDVPPALPGHDALSRLFRDDRDAFEALRSELIERSISRAPARIQSRLRGLQFRIDGIRRLSRSPLGATVKIYSMMWDSFLQMNEALQDMAHSTARMDAVAARRHLRSVPCSPLDVASADLEVTQQDSVGYQYARPAPRLVEGAMKTY